MMHPELAISAQPVPQAVARYRAAVAQIRAGAAVIVGRIHADEQAFGTVPVKRFANTEKEASISRIRPGNPFRQ